MQGREKKRWLHQFALYPSKGFGPEAQSKFVYRRERIGVSAASDWQREPPSLRSTVGLARFGHAFGSFEICRRLFHFAHFLIEGRALAIGQGIIRIK
jgi:hypothetical protein